MTHSHRSIPSIVLHQKIKIILVDDDEDDRQFIIQAFRNVGMKHPIVEFEDGEQFLKELTENGNVREKAAHYGLIVLDINMHKISGLEVLKTVKSHPELKHIPVVMLSTSIEENLVGRAYRLGANGYLQKPNLMDDYNHLAISIQTCFLNVPCIEWSKLE